MENKTARFKKLKSETLAECARIYLSEMDDNGRYQCGIQDNGVCYVYEYFREGTKKGVRVVRMVSTFDIEIGY